MIAQFLIKEGALYITRVMCEPADVDSVLRHFACTFACISNHRRHGKRVDDVWRRVGELAESFIKVRLA